MSELPEWVDSLSNVVSNCMEAHSLVGSLRFRYYEEGELIFYPAPIELLGGEDDGTIVSTGFSLDVKELISSFDQVDSIRWCAQACSPYDAEGANISIEGMYQGHSVWVRVLAYPPDDELPELQLDVA